MMLNLIAHEVRGSTFYSRNWIYGSKLITNSLYLNKIYGFKDIDSKGNKVLQSFVTRYIQFNNKIFRHRLSIPLKKEWP